MKNLLHTKFILLSDYDLKMFKNFFFIQYLNKTVLLKTRWDFMKYLNTNRKKLQQNLIGLNIPYIKRLLLVGVGYRVENHLKNKLQLRLGFSHNVYIQLPFEIDFFFSKKKILILKSFDFEKLTMFVSQLKKLKKFDKYKGKGFLIKNQNVILKIGKKKK